VAAVPAGSPIFSQGFWAVTASTCFTPLLPVTPFPPFFPPLLEFCDITFVPSVFSRVCFFQLPYRSLGFGRFCNCHQVIIFFLCCPSFSTDVGVLPQGGPFPSGRSLYPSLVCFIRQSPPFLSPFLFFPGSPSSFPSSDLHS